MCTGTWCGRFWGDGRIELAHLPEDRGSGSRRTNPAGSYGSVSSSPKRLEAGRDLRRLLHATQLEQNTGMVLEESECKGVLRALRLFENRHGLAKERLGVGVFFLDQIQVRQLARHQSNLGSV